MPPAVTDGDGGRGTLARPGAAAYLGQMANKRAWDVNDHRRFARQFLPPDEFRDGYLGYLDELELKEPSEQAGAPDPESREVPAPGRATQGGAEGPGWPVQRWVLAAMGSVAFALGAWVLTSMP